MIEDKVPGSDLHEEEFVQSVEDVVEEDNTESWKSQEKRPDTVTVSTLEAVFDVPVQITAVLGRSTMPVNQLLKLGRGAVVELDKRVGESIDIFVNDKLVARGEVVVVEDHIGITMTEIVKTERTS